MVTLLQYHIRNTLNMTCFSGNYTSNPDEWQVLCEFTEESAGCIPGIPISDSVYCSTTASNAKALGHQSLAIVQSIGMDPHRDIKRDMQ